MAKHCSVIKGEILLYATCMELDNTILSKLSPSQKNNIKCSHFHVEAKKLISKMQRIKWWLPRPGESMKEERKRGDSWWIQGEEKSPFVFHSFFIMTKSFNVPQRSKVAMFDNKQLNFQHSEQRELGMFPTQRHDEMSEVFPVSIKISVLSGIATTEMSQCPRVDVRGVPFNHQFFPNGNGPLWTNGPLWHFKPFARKYYLHRRESRHKHRTGEKGH